MAILIIVLIKFLSCDLKLWNTWFALSSGYCVHVRDKMIRTSRNERIQVFDNTLFIVAQEISFDNQINLTQFRSSHDRCFPVNIGKFLRTSADSCFCQFATIFIWTFILCSAFHAFYKKYTGKFNFVKVKKSLNGKFKPW